MMPDETVWKNNAAISNAETQVTAMKTLADEIEKLPNGLEIYRLVVLRELVEIGSKNGTNTVVVPIGSNPIIMNRNVKQDKEAK